MDNIKQDNIKHRMAIIAIIPAAGLIWATAMLFLGERVVIRELENVVPLTNLAARSGALVHELQKERGSQVGFISSEGSARFRKIVADQRKLTDKPLADFRAFVSDFNADLYKPALRDYLRFATDDLAKLWDHRATVDKLAMTVPQNVDYYTKIIVALIDIIAIIQEESPIPDITQRLLAYRALIWAKENAGLERAIGAAVFNEAAFEPGLWSRYLGPVAKQDAYLHDFQIYARPEKKALFNQAMKGADVEQFLAWRAILLDLPRTKDTQGVKAADWFRGATKRIDRIKTVENAVSTETIALAKDRLDAAIGRAMFIVVANVAILVVAFIVGGWLLASGAKPSV